jgi:hypothetical protein
MGYFRFRRRIKIVPGVHWNIGKKGSSLSFGGRGLSHTIGPQGSRTTIGIPGTGISYTHVQPHSGPSIPPTPPPSTPHLAQPPNKSKPSRVFYIFGAILLLVWLLSKVFEQHTPTSNNVNLGVSPSPSISFSSTSNSTVPPRSEHSPAEMSSNAVASSPYGTYSANPNQSPRVVRRALPAEPTASARELAAPMQSPVPPASASGTQPSQISAYDAAPLGSPSTLPLVRTFRVVNVAARDFLYLRAGPGATYPPLVKIRAGTRGITLTTNRAANGSTIWQEISVGNYTGWVNETYLEAESPTR